MSGLVLNSEQERDLLNCVTDGGEVFDVVFVGGGVGALSGAIYASRDGLKTLVLEGTMVSSTDSPGGALLLTSEIENFPGFPKGAGYDLIQTIREQALSFGADIREERVADIEFTHEKGKCHLISTQDGNVYAARTIILTMGAQARLLPVEGVEKFLGNGVSTCGTCDAFMFKDRKVVLVGGGDTACEDVLLLTKYASHVTMLVRGKELRSSGPESRIIVDHPDVTILYETELSSIEEKDDRIVKVTTEGKHSEELDVEGVFIAIGSDPATGFLQSSPVSLDSDGYILTLGDSTRVASNIPGVFAAGDVADKVYRQAVTSAGKGVQAALEARSYLNDVGA